MQLVATLLGVMVLLSGLMAARALHNRARDYGGRAPATPLMDQPDQIGIPGLKNVQLPSRDGTLPPRAGRPARRDGSGLPASRRSSEPCSGS